jgi:hypothetical protein
MFFFWKYIWLDSKSTLISLIYDDIDEYILKKFKVKYLGF